jgi:hypothetical protein
MKDKKQNNKIIEITDLYNSDKTWVIKITSCGHYYINQKICNKMFYKKFQKVTKDYLEKIGLDIENKIMKGIN